MTTIDPKLVRMALERAAEITGKADARGELRLVVSGECRYFIAGSQMIAFVTERGDRQRATMPTPGLLCLN